MKPLFVFILSAIILAALVLSFPDLLLNPGPLLNAHSQLKKDCLSCHQPFNGAASVQCISCHKPADIGLKRVSGVPLKASTGKTLFHGKFGANTCTDCHTDHKGTDAKKAIKLFRHDLLPPDRRNSCSSCHEREKPGDGIHRLVRFGCAECHNTSRWKPATFDHTRLSAQETRNCTECHQSDRPLDKHHRENTYGCADCHNTKKWKPAAFDHSRLSAASAKNCISCHRADLPTDNMHRSSQASCAVCHSTKQWKPATFNHSRYFRLDGDHRASCRTCHPSQGNYKSYTCYGCHEHNESRIASEHREEGIYNYGNCMKCHRGGNAEKQYREGFRQGNLGNDD